MAREPQVTYRSCTDLHATATNTEQGAAASTHGREHRGEIRKAETSSVPSSRPRKALNSFLCCEKLVPVLNVSSDKPRQSHTKSDFEER
jgi:hypothetical protein